MEHGKLMGVVPTRKIDDCIFQDDKLALMGADFTIFDWNRLPNGHVRLCCRSHGHAPDLCLEAVCQADTTLCALYNVEEDEEESDDDDD